MSQQESSVSGSAEQPEPAVDGEADDGASLEEPVPYEFDVSHVAVAVAVVSDAYERADARDIGLVVMDAPLPPGVAQAASLRRELVRSVMYSLRLSARGEKPGCTLDPADRGGANGLLPAIRTTSAPVVELWREIAAGVTVPAAVAHFEDLLFCCREGNRMQHAVRAATTYLDVVDGAAVELPQVEMLVRAWALARSVRNTALDTRARASMFTVASEFLATRPGARPGVVLPLLAALAAGPIAAKGVQVPDVHDVDELLTQAAGQFNIEFLASEIARLRRSRTQDPTERVAIARDEVAAYFRAAERAPHPAVRMIKLEAAARVAQRRELTDLAREAASAMQAIKPTDLGFQTITGSSTLPLDVREGELEHYTRSPEWRDGLLYFLHRPPPTGDVQALRHHARNRAGSGLLSAVLPTMLFAGGLPRKTTTSDAEREQYEMSFFASMLAENNGWLLAEGLRRIAERYGKPSQSDLVSFFLSQGGRDPYLARSLAKAFGLFWDEDFESCIHLAIPQFEKAARSLLIELDEGIYRVQAQKDPGGYPGLYVLIAELEKLALDESWAYFFRWLLGGPFGANLRNNVAHGLPADLSPANAVLVLRAVSLLAVVVGAMDHRVHPPAAVTPRTRDAVLAFLGAPLPQRGRVDCVLRWIGSRLERAAWTIDFVRVRRGRR